MHRKAAISAVFFLIVAVLPCNISSADEAPPGYEEIDEAYAQMKKDLDMLRQTQQMQKDAKNELAKSESRIAGLLEELAAKGRELAGIDAAGNVEGYNAVVAEINSLNNDLAKEKSNAKELYEAARKLGQDAAEISLSCRSGFNELIKKMREKENEAGESAMPEDETYFYEEMAENVRRLEEHFKKDQAKFAREGNHIIVDALLNGSVLARLIVDTGASVVVISSDVAVRLGLPYEDTEDEIDIVMADGSTVQARPVILDSVKVGDTQANSVHAAVLENATIGGADGLLGMSFLDNFIVSFDSPNNIIIFEQIIN